MANVSEGRWNQGVGTPVDVRSQPSRFHGGRPVAPRSYLPEGTAVPKGTVLGGPQWRAGRQPDAIRDTDQEMLARLAKLIAGSKQIEEGSVEAGVLRQAIQRLFPGGLQEFMQTADDLSPQRGLMGVSGLPTSFETGQPGQAGPPARGLWKLLRPQPYPGHPDE